jgi:hypothetical protein
MSNPAAPKILNDIVDALKHSTLNSFNEDDEGRVNSKKDEHNIVSYLIDKFKDSIEPVKLRGFGDMIVIDYDGSKHYVNIKTSIGAAPDNAFSKLGFLWAFTDLTIEQIGNKITNEKFTKLVLTHRADINRDYWYLSFDKNDMQRVIVRGAKQITNWNRNPTNNMQINWSKEHSTDLVNYTFEEAWKKCNC